MNKSWNNFEESEPSDRFFGCVTSGFRWIFFFCLNNQFGRPCFLFLFLFLPVSCHSPSCCFTTETAGAQLSSTKGRLKFSSRFNGLLLVLCENTLTTAPFGIVKLLEIIKDKNTLLHPDTTSQDLHLTLSHTSCTWNKGYEALTLTAVNVLYLILQKLTAVMKSSSTMSKSCKSRSSMSRNSSRNNTSISLNPIISASRLVFSVCSIFVCSWKENLFVQDDVLDVIELRRRVSFPIEFKNVFNSRDIKFTELSYLPAAFLHFRVQAKAGPERHKGAYVMFQHLLAYREQSPL